MSWHTWINFNKQNCIFFSKSLYFSFSLGFSIVFLEFHFHFILLGLFFFFWCYILITIFFFLFFYSLLHSFFLSSTIPKSFICPLYPVFALVIILMQQIVFFFFLFLKLIFVSPQVFPDLRRQREYVHIGPFPSVVSQSSWVPSWTVSILHAQTGDKR